MAQIKLLIVAVLVLACLMPVFGKRWRKMNEDEVISEIQQFTSKSKALKEGILKAWDPVEKTYNKMLTDYVKQTFGRGAMNTFAVMHSDQNFQKITEGFIASNPDCNVTLGALTLTDIPDITRLSVQASLTEMLLHASAELDRVIIQGRYSLYRPNGVVDRHSSDVVFSPFSYQEVLDEGEITIIGHQCKLTGTGTLTMVGHTLSLETPNFMVSGCLYEIEITTPYTGTGPVFAPYFDQEQNTHLNLLLSQPIRKTFVMRVNNALYSSINLTSVVGPEIVKEMRVLCDLSTSITRSLFQKIHKRLNGILVAERSTSVRVSDFVNRFNYIKPDGLLGTKLSLHEIDVSGLDSSMWAGVGAAYVSSSNANELHFSEITTLRRLQMSGAFTYFEVGSNTILRFGKFTVQARDVQISCDLISPMMTRRSDRLSLKLNTFNLLGWNHLEMSVFGIGDDENLKSHIKASLAGYCNKALAVVIDTSKGAIPVVLADLNQRDENIGPTKTEG